MFFEQLQRGFVAVRFQSADTEHLGGPYYRIVIQVMLPASDMRDFLTLFEQVLAFQQAILITFSLGDIPEEAPSFEFIALVDLHHE